MQRNAASGLFTQSLEIETGVDLKRPDGAQADDIDNAGFLSDFVQKSVQLVFGCRNKCKPDVVIVIPAVVMRDAGIGVDQFDKIL